MGPRYWEEDEVREFYPENNLPRHILEEAERRALGRNPDITEEEEHILQRDNMPEEPHWYLEWNIANGVYPMIPKLKKFVVVGWKSDPDNKNAPRTPMKPMTVEATHAEAAAKHYARTNQIPEKFWNNGSSRPPIVIRVENAK